MFILHHSLLLGWGRWFSFVLSAQGAAAKVTVSLLLLRCDNLCAVTGRDPWLCAAQAVCLQLQNILSSEVQSITHLPCETRLYCPQFWSF